MFTEFNVDLLTKINFPKIIYGFQKYHVDLLATLVAKSGIYIFQNLCRFVAKTINNATLK